MRWEMWCRNRAARTSASRPIPQAPPMRRMYRGGIAGTGIRETREPVFLGRMRPIGQLAHLHPGPYLKHHQCAGCATGAKGDKGAGFSWEDAWEVLEDYEVGDVVSKSGSSHICIQAHTSSTTNAPDVSGGDSYWDILSAKGSTGSTGATGAKGNKCGVGSRFFLGGCLGGLGGL